MKNILIWESLGILAGGQKVALEVASALSERYECIFLVPEKGLFANEIEKRNFRYYILDIGKYSVGNKGLRDVFAFVIRAPRVFIKAYIIIRREKIKLLYVNSARNFIWSALLGSLMSVPVIWHVHNYFKDAKTKFLINIFGKLKSVIKIVFVADTVRKQFNGLEFKSVVVFNGIDTSRFRSAQNKEILIRREFKIPDNRRLVVTIGWIMPTKRQEILLKAIPSVLKHEKNVHFLFVGGQREGHEAYFNKLLDIVRDSKIEDHMTFTGHRTDIPEILQNSYINVITSEEAFPFTLLEGWASGVPTIGPDFGSIPELIENGTTGSIFQHDSPEDLAENILDLLKVKEKYQKIKEGSLAVVNNYDLQSFNKKLTGLTENILQT